MSKVFNMVGGGSGKNISSIIITGLESTDTVTCIKDGKSYPATWDDIAQHWEIVGLPLGTFTVTATNGTSTKTETVLIDIAGVYEIHISYKLYLYQNGDENEDITGGWVFPNLGTSGFDRNNSATLIREKQTTVIYLYGSRPSGRDDKHIFGSVRTANSVDLSEFSKLNLQYEDCSFTTEEDFRPRFGPSDVIQDGLTDYEIWKKPYQTPLPSGNGTLTIDISDIKVQMYIVVSIYAYGTQANTSTVKINQIWLE